MQTRSRWNFILVMLACVYIFSGCGPTNVFPKPASMHQPKLTAPSLSLLWSLDNIYTIQMTPNPMLASGAGKVFFLGAMQQTNESFGIHCLDGLDGQELWKAVSGSCDNLVLGSDGLYVGCSGFTRVVKYDFNGEVIWATQLRGPGITYMYPVDHQLQVLTSLDELIDIDTSDGKDAVFSGNEIVIFHTPTVSYTGWDGLQAIDNDTEAVLWQVKLDDELDLAPVFLPDLIFLRTGVVMGSIYGIDRSTGGILWRTGDNIISNVASSSTRSKVYALSRDGQLLAIDQDGGQQLVLAEFSSVPFILNGEEIVGGYELAFDDSTQRLYVLLGDSRQLFAFQMK
jgi:outer membrane protein assembly factor BamB